ncbi:hypothetical protein GCK32_016868, partial [Trichostrongylus colubriformis]
RSAETNPRSPTLLQEARGRAEKPWMQTYAPTSSRLSSSLSPNRQWSATSTYDRTYTTDRTLSPSDPSRTYDHTIYNGRTPSPSGVRSREFAERQFETPSPTRYERKYPLPFTSTTTTSTGGVRQVEKPYRSTSPPRDEIRSRTSDRVVSPFR